MLAALGFGFWETDEDGLTEDEIGLIFEENGYVIRFQLIDWWGKALHKLRDQ